MIQCKSWSRLPFHGITLAQPCSDSRVYTVGMTSPNFFLIKIWCHVTRQHFSYPNFISKLTGGWSPGLGCIFQFCLRKFLIVIIQSGSYIATIPFYYRYLWSSWGTHWASTCQTSPCLRGKRFGYFGKVSFFQWGYYPTWGYIRFLLTVKYSWVNVN